MLLTDVETLCLIRFKQIQFKDHNSLMILFEYEFLTYFLKYVNLKLVCLKTEICQGRKDKEEGLESRQ